MITGAGEPSSSSPPCVRHLGRAAHMKKANVRLLARSLRKDDVDADRATC
jgi:hypothetical protein